ncbi:MAG: HAMP domain-containing histidine kinase [Mucilaginibacter polytrichastri]|nr:HAMP domain-containing histidine kinase [Mucilaginibacter polytrichastri]
MGTALLGVMAMQFYFLRESYRLKSELFDRSVNEALSNVTTKLQKQDALNFLTRRSEMDRRRDEYYRRVEAQREQQERENAMASVKRRKLERRLDSLSRIQENMKNLLSPFEAAGNLARQEQNISVQFDFEEYTDAAGNVRQNMTRSVHPVKPAKPRQVMKYDTLRYWYVDPNNGAQIVSVPKLNPEWVALQEQKKRGAEIDRVKKMLSSTMNRHNETPMFTELAQEVERSEEPLSMRLNPLIIDTLLRDELLNQGISLPFVYEVTTARRDSVIFAQAENNGYDRPVFMNASYKAPIFPKDVLSDPGMLRIAFPDKDSVILTKMSATLATSAGLLIVLMLSFGYTLMSILRQKKISEMKTDFINNMTHEFKTPVSTIMIASEALRDEEIAEDKQRVHRLANMIYDENVRLGNHIERVLNIARLERDDFRLDIKPVNANDLISLVLDSMELQFQKKQAGINLELYAAQAIVQADELHFSNILYNLVDNALKYSKEQPRISISTANERGQLIIRVSDNGIGMSREQQARIFEQFYRVPTGNLHDVKGFGLGLSYVQTIVKRLNGTISVQSEKGKGSTFTLIFPASA